MPQEPERVYVDFFQEKSTGNMIVELSIRRYFWDGDYLQEETMMYSDIWYLGRRWHKDKIIVVIQEHIDWDTAFQRVKNLYHTHKSLLDSPFKFQGYDKTEELATLTFWLPYFIQFADGMFVIEKKFGVAHIDVISGSNNSIRISYQETACEEWITHNGTNFIGNADASTREFWKIPNRPL